MTYYRYNCILYSIKPKYEMEFSIMRKIFLALFVSLIVICNIIAGKVFHQRLNYRIIVQEKPTKVQKFAAAELKKFLDRTYSSPVVRTARSSN